jgi:DNA-binding NtrC family response regulator
VSAADPRSFVGEHASVVRIRHVIERVAPTGAPVLITGESGTGKEILATDVHRRSTRHDRPFVAVNCAAIAPNLEESELFGHVAGAFTGAERRRAGRFELAHKGTIFLDEIGDMPLGLQVKLLRILEAGEYVPVGAESACRCDARLIAATNQDLEKLVSEGRFRSDLYYRLCVVRIDVPPLRERREDIPLLAAHFARRFAEVYGRGGPTLAPDFAEFLARYDFPGNVRELANIIHHAVILAEEDRLSMDVIPPYLLRRLDAAAPVLALTGCFHDAKRRLVEQFERGYLLSAIRESGGIVSRAARLAGISERVFHQKLRAYGLQGHSFRRGPP